MNYHDIEDMDMNTYIRTHNLQLIIANDFLTLIYPTSNTAVTLKTGAQPVAEW